MKISREWAMPSKNTFTIKPIKELIKKYVKDDFVVIDPFANQQSIKKEISCLKYISNDLNPKYKTDYNLEAKEFMQLFPNSFADLVLFDPPYSGRQVKECYDNIGRKVTMSDTNSGYFTGFKKEISRILKQNGICITCCWNTNGIGKKYGFELLEVLDVAHGSMHNDTLVVVERKLERRRI